MASPSVFDGVKQRRMAVSRRVTAAIGYRQTSETAVAKRMGRSQTYLWRRTSGETPFDVDDLYAIADILNVTLADLLPVGSPDGVPRIRDESRSVRSVDRDRPTVRPRAREVTGPIPIERRRARQPIAPCAPIPPSHQHAA